MCYIGVKLFENKLFMKLIIATGISGCGRKEYLSKWAKYCEQHGKKVKVYHVGEMMFQLADSMGLKLNKDNILNVETDMLHVLRTSVLNRILAELSDDVNYDAVIICIHGFFYWKSVFRRAFDKFLNKFGTDIFITFIDDFRSVIRRLGNRHQWRHENLTDKEVLCWQNVEVEVTASLAQFADKSFFAIPTAARDTLLYKLIFHPEIEPVYITMPISHFRGPEQRKIIDDFVEKLDQYFAVFNPLSVEVIGAIFIDAEKSKSEVNDFTVERHVVYRDESWFVGQAQKIIAYWPEAKCPGAVKKYPELEKIWPKAISSPGMNHESHTAFTHTKDVWVIFRGNEASPFIASYNTRKDLFYSEEDFFAFLDQEYPDRKSMEW